MPFGCPYIEVSNLDERAGVHYIVGLARNARLEAQVEYAQLAMQDPYEQTGLKQRLVDEFSYAAQSGPLERRVITRLEWGFSSADRAQFTSPTTQ